MRAGYPSSAKTRPACETADLMIATRNIRRISGLAPRCLALLASYAVLMAVATSGAMAADPQIAAGSNHTCTVSQAGILRCMGLNQYGQLGVATNVGTGDPTPTPQVVALGGPAVQVAAAYDQTCAVLADGTVKCFGGNYAGQLGSSVNNSSSTPTPDPQTVPLAGPAAAVSAGQSYSCALLQSSAVQCWGTNQYGTLGVALNSGTTNPTPTPQTVALTGPAIKLSSGNSHACTVLQDGGVQCWGANFYGTLASAVNNNTSFNAVLPVGGGVAGVTADVSAGTSHTCALKQDASVECFGLNQYGQLGNSSNIGLNAANPVPTAVALGAAAKQVASGGDFTCALLTDGSVKCFGNNDRGQLGNTTDNGAFVAHPTPSAVAGLSGPAIRLAAGPSFICAIMQSGSVQCWGLNGAGQLGVDAGTIFSASPLTVPGLSLFDVPPPLPPPPVTKLTYSVKKPKLKVKKSGKKLIATSTVAVNGSGGALSAESCTGKFTASLSGKVKNKRTGKSRTKRYARKSFNLALLGGKCSFKLKLKLPRSTRGKKLTLALTFAGSSTVNPFSQRFTEKIPRGR